MPNLGELLSQNIQREKQAATDSAAALDQQRTEEARRTFLVGKRFFDDARDYFTQGIVAREPVKSLYRQVGGKHYSAAGVECHAEFSQVLQGYQYSDEKRGPNSLHDPKRFASLWHEFQQWAREQGLVATWHYCYDGGGMDSWWQLRVAPAPAQSRGK